jgi:hypothetical protein
MSEQPRSRPRTEALWAENRELRGELEATKALLAATQEMHSRTIGDFCAVRDALPRKQVEQILAAVEHKQ